MLKSGLSSRFCYKYLPCRSACSWGQRYTLVWHRTPFAATLYGCSATLRCFILVKPRRKISLLLLCALVQTCTDPQRRYPVVPAASMVIAGSQPWAGESAERPFPNVFRELSTRANRIYGQLRPRLSLQLWAYGRRKAWPPCAPGWGDCSPHPAQQGLGPWPAGHRGCCYVWLVVGRLARMDSVVA